jgi:hypothetical protein
LDASGRPSRGHVMRSRDRGFGRRPTSMHIFCPFASRIERQKTTDWRIGPATVRGAARSSHGEASRESGFSMGYCSSLLPNS